MRKKFNLPLYDNDMEVANELDFDPFSEEPHSEIHKFRLNKRKNVRNQEETEDNKR